MTKPDFNLDEVILFNLELFQEMVSYLDESTELIESITCTNKSKEVMKYFKMYKDPAEYYITELNNSVYVKNVDGLFPLILDLYDIKYVINDYERKGVFNKDYMTYVFKKRKLVSKIKEFYLSEDFYKDFTDQLFIIKQSMKIISLFCIGICDIQKFPYKEFVPFKPKIFKPQFKTIQGITDNYNNYQRKRKSRIDKHGKNIFLDFANEIIGEDAPSISNQTIDLINLDLQPPGKIVKSKFKTSVSPKKTKRLSPKTKSGPLNKLSPKAKPSTTSKRKISFRSDMSPNSLKNRSKTKKKPLSKSKTSFPKIN